MANGSTRRHSRAAARGTTAVVRGTRRARIHARKAFGGKKLTQGCAAAQDRQTVWTMGLSIQPPLGSSVATAYTQYIVYISNYTGLRHHILRRVRQPTLGKLTLSSRTWSNASVTPYLCPIPLQAVLGGLRKCLEMMNKCGLSPVQCTWVSYVISPIQRILVAVAHLCQKAWKDTIYCS